MKAAILFYIKYYAAFLVQLTLSSFQIVQWSDKLENENRTSKKKRIPTFVCLIFKI